MMNPVATTGRLVASMRAEESRRPDSLSEDSFAVIHTGPVARMTCNQETV